VSTLFEHIPSFIITSIIVILLLTKNIQKWFKGYDVNSEIKEEDALIKSDQERKWVFNFFDLALVTNKYKKHQSLHSVVLILMFVILYFWTVIIAYKVGVLALILSLLLPGLSQIYWFIRVGFSSGFGSPFCIAVLVYLLSFVLFLIISDNNQ